MFMVQEHEHFKPVIGTTALYNIDTKNILQILEG